MSYTRSYHSSVSVSGTVSVSYPASEHGGYTTAHYHETVPININIHVDTNNFDQNVHIANNTIDALTGAVVALDAAECAAIDESSKKISNSLINGFFNTVKSDLTMQKSENNSEIQAKFALLMELSKDMQQKHERMIDDISKLRRHYSELFNGMDDDLHNRIYELDKLSFNLKKKLHEIVYTPYKDGITDGFSQQGETTILNDSLISARLKNKTSSVLKTMGEYVSKTLYYKNSIDKTLINIRENSAKELYIPTMFCSYNNEEIKYKTFVPEKYNNQRINESIEKYMLDNNMWKAYSEEELDNIEKCLFSLFEKRTENEEDFEYQDRVNKEMLRIWNDNKKEIRHI